MNFSDLMDELSAFDEDSDDEDQYNTSDDEEGQVSDRDQRPMR